MKNPSTIRPGLSDLNQLLTNLDYLLWLAAQKAFGLTNCRK